ncbi:hypothetical protein STVIR_8688 [Streptomyces viridochromogenes Tue57]|uniref:Uncharacterized protein n=1 Tax=Streptomyces viridochromogenes Tue57 TaxID=1160705 RepID=L8P2B7_STRVR|nr:hypothetical protein STVIR_8688 [Streptomyces viridochromogenes Tue57]
MESTAWRGRTWRPRVEPLLAAAEQQAEVARSSGTQRDAEVAVPLRRLAAASGDSRIDCLQFEKCHGSSPPS